MSLLASFLLPTRGRFDKLVRVLNSIKETCTPGCCEVILRIDNDDPIKRELHTVKMCKAYGSLNISYLEGDGARVDGKVDQKRLSALWDGPYQVARGKWVIPHSDDILITTTGWDKELERQPATGVIVWPNVHKLNESTYLNDANGCLPIIPNKSVPRMIYPPDRAPCKELRNKGWRDVFINMGIHHIREADETLPVAEY